MTKFPGGADEGNVLEGHVELEKPAVAKKGDVWTLGRHRLMVGDSTLPEIYDVLMKNGLSNSTTTSLKIFIEDREAADYKQRLLTVEFYKLFML